MSFDLKNLDVKSYAEKGARVELKHPATGEKIGWFITVIGSDSSRYRDMIKARVRQNLVNKEEIDLDKSEERDIELLSRCTLSWEGLVENGVPVPFNEKTCKEVYTNYPWIREQVDKAIADRSLFLKQNAQN